MMKKSRISQRPVNIAESELPPLSSKLQQAEMALYAKGIEAVLMHLRSGAQVEPQPQRTLNDAKRLTVLGQFILPRDPKSALQLAKAALDRDRDHIAAFQLAGIAQDKLGYRKGASLAFALVVKSKTAQPAQVLQAANMLVRMGDQAVALKAARGAFEAMGKPLGKVSSLLYIAQKTADWALVDELTAQLKSAYQDGRFDEARESTRTHLNWCADERWNLEVIRRWNQRSLPHVATGAPRPEPLLGRRLRVGYLSSDFRKHPTSRLANGLFRHHDRSRVELFMYCSGWNDGSAMRQEVTSHFDHIHSVARLSDAEAAELIRSHRIDVLVELNGPTRAHRMGILAHQPAPVQIDYLGWHGSLGGRVVDAIVADDYVVPAGNEAQYPEQLIRLNKTYQVNDYAALTRPVLPSKAEAKLPERPWLILGMFNGIEKFSNAVWAAWMEILRQVPHALIWLLDPGEVAKKHIAEVTKAHGIDTRRILIAPKKPQDAHLARLGLCDLILDPWPYGGHTTTSDALFAGVPVVALEGTNFASRVSGSLLNAAGLGALVAKDLPGYIALAVKLLKSPAELQRLKTFIEQRVPRLDVFDAKGKARQLEEAYYASVTKKLESYAFGWGDDDEKFALGISKFIYQTAKSMDDLHPVLRENIEKIKRVNPDFDYQFFDDDAVGRFMKENCTLGVYEAWSSIDPQYGAARADLFRYCLMYERGGVYLDIKSTLQKPLREVLRKNDCFLLSHWENSPGGKYQGWGRHPELSHIAKGEYQQWFIACSPRHPFLAAVIKHVIENIKEYNPLINGVGKKGVLRLSGPIAYSFAIEPIRTKWPHRLVSAERDLEFVYSLHPDGGLAHESFFKDHYSRSKLPIVRKFFKSPYLRSGDIKFPLVIASHERSGTHFLMNSIAACTAYVARPRVDFDEKVIGNALNFRSQFDLQCYFDGLGGNKPVSQLIKSHYAASRMKGALSAGVRIIYIYRNPGDVLLSYWRFLHRFPEEGPVTSTPLEFCKMSPSGASQRYQDRVCINYLERWLCHVRGWLDLARAEKNVVVVSYESLLNNFSFDMLRLLGELNVNLTSDPEMPRKTNHIKGSDVLVTDSDLNELKKWIKNSIGDDFLIG